MLSEGEILNNASAKEIILVILNSLLLLVLKKVYCIVLYSKNAICLYGFVCETGLPIQKVPV